MALPDNLKPGLLPSEAEFIATSVTEIHIVPLMRIDRVRLLGGVYGPLRPPTQAKVPLWLALNLKRRKRCSVVCPEWLQIGGYRILVILFVRSSVSCREFEKHTPRGSDSGRVCFHPIALHGYREGSFGIVSQQVFPVL